MSVPTSYKDPTAEDAIALFTELEKKFPSASLGDDKWYLVALAALCASTQPEFAVNLYAYLIDKSEFASSCARQQLMRRMREGLVECVAIIGICKPLEAIFAISKIERPEDRDYSFSRSVDAF
ncbi:MAG: hypothetical protein M1818_008465 [Claussenomyces sp. TS43310]|nr:MAG: hypothetical protein M1818_008465 [Claussenomyces sp. TS43310]